MTIRIYKISPAGRYDKVSLRHHTSHQNYQIKKLIIKDANMLRKKNGILAKQYCLFSFILLISAAFILGTGIAPASAAKKADVQKAVVGLVDINNATQKELENVKGVGLATAKKIIAGRPYKSVDELSKAGIKPKAIEAMKPFVTVGNASMAPVTEKATKAVTKATAPLSAAATDLTTATDKVKTKSKSASAKLAPGTKININTADQAMLEKLPEIGPAKAKDIIAGRPYNTIEDVTKVKGIKEKTFDVIKDYIVVK